MNFSFSDRIARPSPSRLRLQLQRSFLVGAFVVLTTTVGQAATIYYLATGQTGGQTQIDVNHTSSWLMTPNTDFQFAGGLFTMKDGQTTASAITLSLYQGLDSSGTLLGSTVLSTPTFCASVSNCGQYNYHEFDFTTPFTLSTGATYYLALTSVAPDVQSQAYFIKNDSFFISDQVGNAIQPQPVTFGTPSAATVPEPESIWLTALGAGCLFGTQRWRRSRRPAPCPCR